MAADPELANWAYCLDAGMGYRATQSLTSGSGSRLPGLSFQGGSPSGERRPWGLPTSVMVSASGREHAPRAKGAVGQAKPKPHRFPLRTANLIHFPASISLASISAHEGAHQILIMPVMLTVINAVPSGANFRCRMSL